MKKAILIAIAVSAALGVSPAFAVDVAGTASGAFVNPTPTSAGIVVTGVGSSVFTYGDAAGFGTGPNSLTFGGGLFSGAFNTPFKVGTLTYFNGTTAVGSTPSAVDLALTTNFSTPTGLNSVLSTFTLGLVITPNGGIDADADADFVTLPAAFVPSLFLINGTTYTVRLVDFENVTGDGFLPSDSTQFHVREGGTASADLYAEVTTNITGAVPEPSTWAMMILGFAGVGFMAYRRKQTGPAFRMV